MALTPPFSRAQGERPYRSGRRAAAHEQAAGPSGHDYHGPPAGLMRGAARA